MGLHTPLDGPGGCECESQLHLPGCGTVAGGGGASGMLSDAAGAACSTPGSEAGLPPLCLPAEAACTASGTSARRNVSKTAPGMSTRRHQARQQEWQASWLDGRTLWSGRQSVSRKAKLQLQRKRGCNLPGLLQASHWQASLAACMPQTCIFKVLGGL